MRFLDNILAKAGLVVDGAVTLNNVAAASTNTDRFLVVDSGVVKYRTGSQLLSDISAVGGSGTINYVSKFTGATTLGNSQVFDDGTSVGINTNTPSVKFEVAGGSRVSGTIQSQTYTSGLGTSTTGLISSLVQSSQYSATSAQTILGVVGSPNVTASSGFTQVLGGSFDPIADRTSTSATLAITGVRGTAYRNSSTTPSGTMSSTLTGVQGLTGHWTSQASGANTLGAIGVWGNVTSQKSTITNGYGIFSQIQLSTDASAVSPTVNNYYGVYTTGTLGRSDGTTIGNLTNYYDAYLAGATVNSGIFVTKRWGVYQANVSHPNYFAAIVQIGSNTSTGETLQVTGTQRVTQDAYFATASGNVGIGTTSPSELLDVNGRIRARTIDNNAAPTFFLTSDANGVIQKSTYAPAGGSGTTNYVARWTSSSALGTGVLFDNGSFVGVGVTSNFAGGPRLYVSKTTASEEILRVDGQGGAGCLIISNTASSVQTVFYNGNIGVGTLSPQQKFVVSNVGAEGLEFIPAPSVNSNQIQSYNRSTSAWNSLVLRASEYNVQIGTNPALFINNSSNVGIGTTSPAVKLEVSGVIRGTRLNSTGGVVDFDAQTGNNFIQVASNIMSFANGSAVNMTIAANGNVGIGTISPTQKLHVLGDTRIENGSIFLTQGRYITWNSGDNYIRGLGGYHLQFTTYDGVSGQHEVLRLTGGTLASGGGRVGIGATSPIGKLNVLGSSGSNSIGNVLNNGVINSSLVGISNLSLVISHDTTVNRPLLQSANASDAFSLLINPYGGNVLIGTTTDGSFKLDVNGAINTNAYLSLSGSSSITTSDYLYKTGSSLYWKRNRVRTYIERTISGISSAPADYNKYYEIGSFSFFSLEGLFNIDIAFNGGGFGQGSRHIIPLSYNMDYLSQYSTGLATYAGNNVWLAVDAISQTPRHILSLPSHWELQMNVVDNVIRFRIVIKGSNGESGTATAFIKISHNNDFDNCTYTELTGTGTDTATYPRLPAIMSGINGTTLFQNTVRVGTLAGTGTRMVVAGSDGTLSTQTLTAGSVGAVGGSGTTNYIPKFTGSSTIGNSSILENPNDIRVLFGNGILRFRNISDTHVFFELRPNSGKSARIAFTEDSVADRWQIGTNAGNGAFVFDQGSTGTERLRIESSGNVGIGTTSPVSRLVVEGEGAINSFAGVLRISNTSTARWGYISLPDTQATISEVNNYYLIGRGGSTSDRVMSFHIPNTSNYGSGSQPKFGFYSTGVDLLCSIEASTGTTYFKGNVGIGTSSPTHKLEVVGDAMTITSDGVYGIGFAPSSGERGGFIQTIQNADRNGVMFFAANGNIGIGTSAPAQKLEIRGDGDQWIRINNQNNAGAKAGVQLFANNSYRSALYFDDQAGTTYLTSALGTNQLLHVVSGNTLNLEASGANIITYRTNGNERMRITSAGEIGIGTASPSAVALLEMSSTSKGFLPPRMTAAQRGAISTPPAGLVVYQTDGNEGLWLYTVANGWRALAIVV